MFVDIPTLDTAVKITHIVGLPAIIGAIVWLVRTFDGATRVSKEVTDGVKQTLAVATEVKANVDTIKTNHLQHLAENMNKMTDVQGDTVRVLTSIDKGISILVDRAPRV